eukprot:Hpha_TRINITY_DN1436_c0_g1::TRINITY_DN1436_c0_g1_i1::g.9595::m.9595
MRVTVGVIAVLASLGCCGAEDASCPSTGQRQARSMRGRGPPGIRRRPLSWSETVQALIDEGLDADGRPLLRQTLGRSPGVMQAYLSHRREMKSRHGSALNAIIARYFSECHGLPECPQRRSLLLPNAFPYFFEGGMTHSVVWVTGANITAQEVRDAAAEIRKEGSEAVWWVSHSPSVPGRNIMDHAHVLVRDQAADGGATGQLAEWFRLW